MAIPDRLREGAEKGEEGKLMEGVALATVVVHQRLSPNGYLLRNHAAQLRILSPVSPSPALGLLRKFIVLQVVHPEACSASPGG